jgi:xanthine dehydrogenase iron-sulfur cluster and FAD-binding subunit A
VRLLPPGQTLAAVALLESDESPDDATIRRWMNGNVCRCGTYPRICDAIHAAAEMLASGERPEPMRALPDLELPPLTEAEKSEPVARHARRAHRRSHAEISAAD